MSNHCCKTNDFIIIDGMISQYGKVSTNTQIPEFLSMWNGVYEVFIFSAPIQELGKRLLIAIFWVVCLHWHYTLLLRPASQYPVICCIKFCRWLVIYLTLALQMNMYNFSQATLPFPGSSPTFSRILYKKRERVWKISFMCGFGNWIIAHAFCLAQFNRTESHWMLLSITRSY